MTHIGIQQQSGFRPLGGILAELLCRIAVRALHFHWRRAEDHSLSQADRAQSLREAEGIIATCRRHGLVPSDRSL